MMAQNSISAANCGAYLHPQHVESQQTFLQALGTQGAAKNLLTKCSGEFVRPQPANRTSTDMGKKRGFRSAFVAKLWQILDNPLVGHIICWDDTGTMFTVKNRALFCDHVLPQYFSHGKFASFQRQLNYFHFRRCQTAKSTKGRQSAFSHPHFRRDNCEAALAIHRTYDSRRPAASTHAQNEEPRLKKRSNAGSPSLMLPSKRQQMISCQVPAQSTYECEHSLNATPYSYDTATPHSYVDFAAEVSLQTTSPLNTTLNSQFIKPLQEPKEQQFIMHVQNGSNFVNDAQFGFLNEQQNNSLSELSMVPKTPFHLESRPQCDGFPQAAQQLSDLNMHGVRNQHLCHLDLLARVLEAEAARS
jgi:hypothetical protein